MRMAQVAWCGNLASDRLRVNVPFQFAWLHVVSLKFSVEGTITEEDTMVESDARMTNSKERDVCGE